MSSTNEKRSEAGRKGGEAVSEDREHMSEIGKKGGEESHKDSSTNQGEHLDFLLPLIFLRTGKRKPLLLEHDMGSFAQFFIHQNLELFARFS